MVIQMELKTCREEERKRGKRERSDGLRGKKERVFFALKLSRQTAGLPLLHPLFNYIEPHSLPAISSSRFRRARG